MSRRPIQRDSETGAIPSRAAATLRLRDARRATSNLTPFAKSTNSQHHAYVEKKAKAIFARGNVVRYKVTVNYGSSPPTAWFGNKIPATYLAHFAHSIECILDEHDPATGDSVTGKEDVTTITNAITGQG